MKNLFKIICITLVFFFVKTNAQTLTALQMQNARATGYAIVAARNPGKSFSVNLVKWDGIHDLEYNANNQINMFWHPQAVVKGNYFNQPFDGTDFTTYSSVVVSQEEFDTYKATGSDWWIVCSNLPSYSNSGLSVLDNGKVGIGTINPAEKLEVNGSILAGTNGTVLRGRYSSVYPSGQTTSYFDLKINNEDANNGGMSVMTAFGGNMLERLTIKSSGNVGIGTPTPDAKLTVNGNIHAKEVKIDLSIPAPDYVFAPDYKLKSLKEVEDYIKENSHLPEIPSAKELEKNGLMLAEMNMSLLKKMEEMTLYMIEQNKKLEKQNEKILVLEDKVKKNETASK